MGSAVIRLFRAATTTATWTRSGSLRAAAAPKRPPDAVCAAAWPPCRSSSRRNLPVSVPARSRPDLNGGGSLRTSGVV